ncbi:uncharacterized protein DS421_14g463950 [Arachis hypogaea]|nr:uncharacterized protein DS421_14g463950 [Arachis hypogaea]
MTHTLLPLDAIVPYLRDAGFGDAVPLRNFGECTITLQDVAYHLGLHANGDPVSGCFRDFHTWYATEAWELVERLLGVRPPAVQ